jgi:hypothetical protein
MLAAASAGLVDETLGTINLSEALGNRVQMARRKRCAIWPEHSLNLKQHYRKPQSTLARALLSLHARRMST